MDDGCAPDDFDIDFDADEPECAETTVLRATIRGDGRLTMTCWMPGLAENGPAGVHFRARERAGIAIADLHLVRDHNGQHAVLVEFMAQAGPGRGRSRALLMGKKHRLPTRMASRRARRCRGPGADRHRHRGVPHVPRDVERLNGGVLGAGGTQRLLPHDLPHLRTHHAPMGRLR